MSAPELRDVLDELGRRAVASTALSAEGLEAHISTLTRQARRRRVVRASVMASGAAAAVLVGALAVQGVEGLRPVPPVDSPSPSVAETPRPTASPTPDASPTLPPPPDEPVALGGVTVHPALPSALPLLEGMLEATTEDWHLVTTRPLDVPGAPDGPVVYLVNPDGQRYEVPTLLELDDDTEANLAIDAWLPGSTLAIVLPWYGDGGDGGVQGYQVVDLLTGEVVGDVPVPEEEWPTVAFVGDGTTDVLVSDRVASYDEDRSNGIRRLTADGREVARYGAFAYPEAMATYEALLSPDRARLLVSRAEGIEVLATDDLAVVATVPLPDTGPCTAWSWWDDSTALVACGTEEFSFSEGVTGPGPDSLWLVSVDGGAPRLLGDDVARFAFRAVVGDQAILGEFSPTGTDLWTSLSRDGGFTSLDEQPLTSVRVHRGTESRLILQAVTEPEPLTDVLYAVDLITGQRVELVPNPAGALALHVARG